MRNIKIVADSSANILALSKTVFAAAPLKVITNETEFVDDCHLASVRTIYRWIYEKYIDVNLKVLRRKGKSRGKKETRGKFSLGKTIRKRDKSVYKRQEFGHWEADTVVSGRGKSKVCFATLAERRTRYYIAIKMPNRNADTMAKTIIAALSKLPDEAVKTITCDRGTEFANWRTIEEQLNCNVYFADPYCAWLSSPSS